MKKWKKGMLMFLVVAVVAIAVMLAWTFMSMKPGNLFDGSWQGIATLESGQFMEIDVLFDEQSKTYGHMIVKGGWTDETQYPVQFADGVVTLDPSAGSGSLLMLRENGLDSLTGVMKFDKEELVVSLQLRKIAD